MSEQHGLPQDLPPAYVPPAYIAPASALDQPALGLVLVFAALLGLPQAAMMVAQVLFLDIGFDGKIAALGGLIVGTELLQLVAGLAIAWQWRARWPLFVASLVCGAALVLCVFVLWRDELGARQATVMALESLGSPLLVVLAPRLFGLTRITRGHALGGLLIVSGISILVYQPVSAVGYARMFYDGHASVGSWLGQGVSVVVALATATLEIITGLRMARGQPARRWLAAWAIVALVGYGGMDLAGMIYWLLEDREPHTKYVLVNLLIGFVLSVARPLIVWPFAKRETEASARIDAALPWVALWFVPQLAARCLLGEEVTMLLGNLAWPVVVLCAAAGVAALVAARASLRDEPSVWAWRVAAGIAGALVVVVVFWVLASHAGSTWQGGAMFNVAAQAVPPVALLFATMATGAWLARRVPSSQ